MKKSSSDYLLLYTITNTNLCFKAIAFIIKHFGLYVNDIYLKEFGNRLNFAIKARSFSQSEI